MKIPDFDLMKNISGHLDKLVKYPQILWESTESPISRGVCKFQTQRFCKKFKTSKGKTTVMYRTHPQPGFTPDPETTDQTKTAFPQDPLLCAACRTKITWKQASISISGSHSHVFVNPAGLVFEVGCFSRAINLSGLGPITSEFTWFPGYSWQTALCSFCHSQIGWIYNSEDESVFFGLILDRLIED